VYASTLKVKISSYSPAASAGCALTGAKMKTAFAPGANDPRFVDEIE
jgi:hypothetical protein